MSVIVLVEQAVAYILQVLGISQLIYGLLQQFGVIINQTAKEHFPFEVQGLGLAANNQLADPTFGLAAIKTELDGIGLAIIALGNPQQDAIPVTLPSTAPSTFLDNTNGGTAAAIWNYTDFRGLFTPFGIEYALYNWLNGQRQTWAMELPSSNYFRVSTDLLSRPVVNWPVLAPAGPDSILSTDTDVGAWLARTQPTLTWIFLTGQQVWQATFAGPPNVYIQCTMGQAEFEWFRDVNTNGLPQTLVPPVWPGLANVTFGTTVSLDPTGGDVTADCDGITLSIDAHPGWAGKFDFGGLTSWRNAGAIAFKSDQGREEPAQTINWADGFYMPRTMARAAGFCYRIGVGWHAAATPFIINP